MNHQNQTAPAIQINWHRHVHTVEFSRIGRNQPSPPKPGRLPAGATFPAYHNHPPSQTRTPRQNQENQKTRTAKALHHVTRNSHNVNPEKPDQHANNQQHRHPPYTKTKRPQQHNERPPLEAQNPTDPSTFGVTRRNNTHTPPTTQNHTNHPGVSNTNPHTRTGTLPRVGTLETACTTATCSQVVSSLLRSETPGKRRRSRHQW